MNPRYRPPRPPSGQSGARGGGYRSQPKANSTTIYILGGAGAVLLVVILALASGSAGSEKKPPIRTPPAAQPTARPSDQRRTPTEDEKARLKTAGAQISEAKRLFQSIMVETQPGKWDLTSAYEGRRAEARSGLQRAKDLCMQANPLVEKIVFECGAEWVPPECDIQGMLKRIRTGIQALGD